MPRVRTSGRYDHDVARRHGLLGHIEYGKDVEHTKFDGARWTVTCRDGSSYEADVVIAAAGRLRDPKLPAIVGTESFAGPSFHTARWEHQRFGEGQARRADRERVRRACRCLPRLPGTLPLSPSSSAPRSGCFRYNDAPVPWWKRLAYGCLPPMTCHLWQDARFQQFARHAGVRDRGPRDAIRSASMRCNAFAIPTARAADAELRMSAANDW